MLSLDHIQLISGLGLGLRLGLALGLGLAVGPCTQGVEQFITCMHRLTGGI